RGEHMREDLKRPFPAPVRLASGYAVRPSPGRTPLFRPSASPIVAPPADRGWGRLAADVEVRFVPGQHHSMVKEPHVRALARELRTCLLVGLRPTSDSPSGTARAT